jgi:multidrug efflux pump subunit AcrA (membrane-fusion protein)
MRSLKDYLTEAEDYITKPAVGDVFEIEIARDEMLISGYITECVNDGIVIELDNRGVELLEGYGYVAEAKSALDKIDSRFKSLSGRSMADAAKEYGAEAERLQKEIEAQQAEIDRRRAAQQNEDLTADQEGTMTSADLEEAEYRGRKVSLGKPMQGDVKKFKVYVKKPNGNVVKVNFGDPNMRIKKSNPARRRSFRARHNCDNPGPRWKARYWSCRKW